MSTPTELQLAEQALDKAREEVVHIEPGTNPNDALDRYVAAVIARNGARERAGT